MKLLADGAFHSGTAIGSKLGVTRAAVCKTVQALSAAGLEIESVSGRGYRMAIAAHPLERRTILKALVGVGISDLDVEILEEIDSTSRYLMQNKKTAPRVCLAEAQPQGRGRRGRAWITTPYHNLMLSMSWQFAAGPAAAAGLSLAAGVALARALETYGVRSLGLKWPNDILVDGRKLGGVLVDLQGEANGPTRVVVGIGVNGYLGARAAARIDQPWIDLYRIMNSAVDRNRLAALVVAELYRMFEDFSARGLAPFRRDWERRHLYQEQRVRLDTGETSVVGTAIGVDELGALVLRTAQGQRETFHAGEISLRPA
ncbi:MAG: biotin--[acetyl-CoA-carboxylase] ligase [Pseudomonadota bacterium]|nr:MAG: biotin--[acetyl-CoA-carboxylase] ligase [Pseudomonadota bacterium]